MENKNKGGIRWRALIITLGIIVVIIIFSVIIGQQDQQRQIQQTTNTPLPGICDTPLATLKQQSQHIDYKQLTKDPESFNGKITTFTGKIFQIQQSGNQGIIRLGVTKTPYNTWDINDVVYITYHKATPAVEDNIVTVTGKVTGSVTYTSQANYQITIPGLDVCSVQTNS